MRLGTCTFFESGAYAFSLSSLLGIIPLFIGALLLVSILFESGLLFCTGYCVVACF